MKKHSALMVAALWLAGYGWSYRGAHPDASLRGFFPGQAAREAEFERVFRSLPTPERARHDLWILTQAPHVAGTPEDYKTAQYVLSQFREAGLEAKIAEYQVLLPMPKEVKVELVEPFKREGPTPEGGWSRDKDAYDSSVVPAFNAYSPSGDVTARVVYANYGLPDDYRVLREQGIDVTEKIVIVRYGKCFRGVKAYVAEENHAAGLLIYSDPADDGYRQGDVYPRGPWRPSTAVQRGSILYQMIYSGDPLTPGVAATKGAKRLSMKEASTLPHIPTMPLSYEDASPILENLAGPVAPREWQGALPITYHLGPGASKIHLKLDMDFQVRAIWDVIAQVPGSAQPDWWVVVGNHRDAWAYGAADPASGTAPLLAVARGLGQLLKQGWKPQRTVVLASWDAEEFGLIGSTEWAEEHANELTKQAVAYLNMDVGVSGPHFGASAVPSLAGLIREVTEEVTDPNSGRPLYAVWSEESRKLRREPGAPIVVPLQEPAPDSGEARVGELGSGSDYTPFLQHLGVPSLDLGFGGSYGVYHAIYDNFYWMEHFGDPSFKYSVAAAQVYGTLALRLADADILPFDYTEYGKAIQKYLRDLEEEMEKSGVGDKISFDEVTSAAAKFNDAAKALAPKMDATSRVGMTDARRLATFNHALIEVERNFLLADGLPNRAWFRHAFYAPGVYTGYEAVVLPGVREAARRKDWATAAQQLALVRGAIERGTVTLTQALHMLGEGGAASGNAPGRGATWGHATLGEGSPAWAGSFAF
jgi:N-acetylated-alpha-linked acidic dipeptidase